MGGLLTRGKDASGRYVCGASGNRASPRPHCEVGKPPVGAATPLPTSISLFFLPRIQFCSGAYAAAGIHGNGKLNTAAAPAADADVQTKQHRPVL